MKSIRFAWLLVAAALLTIALKTTAYLVTGSVGLLSDALESLVNLAAAVLALTMLSIAARPPDDLHAYGHSKAEYFSSGVEGSLIVISAVGIGWAAIPRLITPHPLDMIGTGAIVAAVATLINLAVARILMRASVEYRSAALEASARHLVTDVWTSGAVIAGVGIVALTGWQRLDPLLALIVAANIVRTGVQLLRDAALGLMDTALPDTERAEIVRVLESFAPRQVQYHALLTRRAGARKFVSVHVLVPGQWDVKSGHQLLDELETAMHAAVPGLHVVTHLEPREDPAAFADIELDRH